MSDRSVPAFQRRASNNRTGQVIEAMIQKTTALDPDLWVVMDERDNTLIEEEILHGAGSSKYVYKFSTGGSEVSGISVVGARELASHYGGIRHTMVGSISKTGALFVMKSYPREGIPMNLYVQHIPDLADEPDYYEVLAEVRDMKTGNAVMVERKEFRMERRSRQALQDNPNLPEEYERPHYQTIAGSKAYRNGVLSIIPQGVQLAWKVEMLRLNKTDIITGSVINEKRSGVLRYAASKAIGMDRDAVEALTMDQISGLSDAVREGKLEQFIQAAEALGIVVGGEEERPRPRIVSVPTGPTVRPTQPAGNSRSVGSTGRQAAPKKEEQPKVEAALSKAETKPEVESEQGFDVYAIDEFGEPIADNDGILLNFNNPKDFALWFVESLRHSPNPDALRDNNADALDDVQADAEAMAIINEATQAPLPRTQDKPIEPPTPQVAVVPLDKFPNGRPNWAQYSVRVEEAMKGITTLDGIKAWSVANEVTYKGKAWAAKVDHLVIARRLRIEGGNRDIDMDRAQDLVGRIASVQTMKDYEDLTSDTATKTWLTRMGRERNNDIRPMLEDAGRAAIDRFKSAVNQSVQPSPPDDEIPPNESDDG